MSKFARYGRRKPSEAALALVAELRAFPGEVQKEFRVEAEVLGDKLVAAMQARAPKRTGALRAGISRKWFPVSMRLEVGLRDTKRGRSDLFYGRIQEFGRRQTSSLYTIRLAGGGKSKPAVRTIPAMDGKKFVFGQLSELRREGRLKLQGIFARLTGKMAA